MNRPRGPERPGGGPGRGGPGRGPEPRYRDYGRDRYRFAPYRYRPIPYPYYQQPYAPSYPGYQQQGYCPYGGTAYTLQADTDVGTLANQLGVSIDTIINFNPGLSVNSTVGSGQVICLPNF